MMPEKTPVERAEKDKRGGKAPSTQAGEFVHEEMHHVREGRHGARSPEQMIAIGLSKARSAGVKLRAPRKGKASAKTRRNAKLALKRARSQKKKTSPKRSRAVLIALKREGHSAASRPAAGRLARSPPRPRRPPARPGSGGNGVPNQSPRRRFPGARQAAPQ